MKKHKVRSVHVRSWLGGGCEREEGIFKDVARINIDNEIKVSIIDAEEDGIFIAVWAKEGEADKDICVIGGFEFRYLEGQVLRVWRNKNHRTDREVYDCAPSPKKLVRKE